MIAGCEQWRSEVCIMAAEIFGKQKKKDLM